MTRAVCCSHIGKRSNHEDNFFFDGKILTAQEQAAMNARRMLSMTARSTAAAQVYAVSDGMGGYNAGEVASRLCAEMVVELRRTVWGCTSVEEMTGLAQSYIGRLNTAVCKMSRSNEACRDMGATLVLLLICGTARVILNVGDSRAYSFTNGILRQITKDHTEGRRLLDLGLLTQQELEHFPARKYLNRYIGCGQPGYVQRADEYTLAPAEDLVLLCSDGVTDALSDGRILDILRRETNIESAGKRLVEEAAATENADNVTTILIQMRG